MSDFGDALKAFSIDTWYKAVVVVGGIAFVIALFLDVKGLTNGQLQLLGGGAFLFGLGYWKNQTVATEIKPPNAYTGGVAFFNRNIRRATPVGVLLELIGLALVCIATWRIIGLGA